MVSDPKRDLPTLPLGFAHRGARAECRDNTLRSFSRALELGAAAVESDVWLTADGVAVLDHDGQVRQGLRRVPIKALRRADLPRHIPTVAELYDLIGPEVDVSLDVKDVAAAGAVIEMAAGIEAASRLWLCGDGPVLARWRELSADVRLVASTSPARLAGGAGGFAGGVGRAAAAGADAVNMRWSDWDATRVATVHDAGMLAFAWDAQRDGTIAAVLALGADGVYSDHVGVMTAALARWRATTAP
ncbi:MAG TPA: glycerophosphodiester phosphodiesterase [Acidimicrobiales bacterium]|nr:glycerophosphodiester phosphodiesterase [Acidimicrobiales bacterium]